MTSYERPLDQIRKETKAAHRAPHLRKNNLTPVDQIDSLDNILGATYHHDGPYDATLASRNRNRKYAPVDAVQETNKMALDATPIENLQDSLRKHVPLAGTANIPPGQEDLAGRTMRYEEGADLMREEDAEGGPYRRWKDYDYEYQPGDLKGKGEPSYSIERQIKERGASASGENGTAVYEMQPGGSSRKDGGTVVRQRSYSSSAGPSSPQGAAHDSNVRRSNTVGKRSGLEGLKRRIGSLRRKSPDQA
ncbi:hypothetical protein JX265_001538 [Neoarthrinium moseri]|uniref:Pal1 cell morphology n=1 Tax=Neoarthrinium moseri TaxID=1658444 RepID=A0A9Q0ATW8_9PEZI|nr:hypothetical protein JX265_001538 [Neoarthrinium moseri]